MAPALGLWFFDHTLLTAPLVVAAQVGVVHENTADSLGSLRRVASRP